MDEESRFKKAVTAMEKSAAVLSNKDQEELKECQALVDSDPRFGRIAQELYDPDLAEASEAVRDLFQRTDPQGREVAVHKRAADANTLLQLKKAFFDQLKAIRGGIGFERNYRFYDSDRMRELDRKADGLKLATANWQGLCLEAFYDIKEGDSQFHRYLSDIFAHNGFSNYPPEYGSGYASITVSRTGEFHEDLPFALEIKILPPDGDGKFFSDSELAKLSRSGFRSSKERTTFVIKSVNQIPPIPSTIFPSLIELRNRNRQGLYITDDPGHLLDYLAHIVTSQLHPWDGLAQTNWQKYCLEHKEAIVVYNDLGKAQGEIFPHDVDVSQLFMDGTKGKYESIIARISLEVDKIKLLQQIAQNTGASMATSSAILRETSHSSGALSRIEIDLQNLAGINNDTRQTTANSAQSLLEIRRMIAELSSSQRK